VLSFVAGPMMASCGQAPTPVEDHNRPPAVAPPIATKTRLPQIRRSVIPFRAIRPALSTGPFQQRQGLEYQQRGFAAPVFLEWSAQDTKRQSIDQLLLRSVADTYPTLPRALVSHEPLPAILAEPSYAFPPLLTAQDLFDHVRGPLPDHPVRLLDGRARIERMLVDILAGDQDAPSMVALLDALSNLAFAHRFNSDKHSGDAFTQPPPLNARKQETDLHEIAKRVQSALLSLTHDEMMHMRPALETLTDWCTPLKGMGLCSAAHPFSHWSARYTELCVVVEAHQDAQPLLYGLAEIAIMVRRVRRARRCALYGLYSAVMSAPAVSGIHGKDTMPFSAMTLAALEEWVRAWQTSGHFVPPLVIGAPHTLVPSAFRLAQPDDSSSAWDPRSMTREFCCTNLCSAAAALSSRRTVRHREHKSESRIASAMRRALTERVRRDSVSEKTPDCLECISGGTPCSPQISVGSKRSFSMAIMPDADMPPCDALDGDNAALLQDLAVAGSFPPLERKTVASAPSAGAPRGCSGQDVPSDVDRHPSIDVGNDDDNGDSDDSCVPAGSTESPTLSTACSRNRPYLKKRRIETGSTVFGGTSRPPVVCDCFLEDGHTLAHGPEDGGLNGPHRMVPVMLDHGVVPFLDYNELVVATFMDAADTSSLSSSLTIYRNVRAPTLAKATKDICRALDRAFVNAVCNARSVHDVSGLHLHGGSSANLFALYPGTVIAVSRHTRASAGSVFYDLGVFVALTPSVRILDAVAASNTLGPQRSC